MKTKDFVPAVHRWLEEHGARETPGARYEWELFTRAGLLAVSVVADDSRKLHHSMQVFTCFDIPEKALKVLRYGVNPHSGKWNHHYFQTEGTTPQEAFDDVTARLGQLLIKEKCYA
jgi:hypothetical protein